MVHDESCKVAHAFNEPLSTVSHNIISTATWGAIYCLLGAERMGQMHPEYQDIIDEVELELMGSDSELLLENSVSHRVFAILTEHSLCHPDVIALTEACVLTKAVAAERDFEGGLPGFVQG
jgi:hypothetical protein